MHERLKHMKETLVCAIESQLSDLSEVDTKELGEAIDMIKDLEEAIYYCTVTEAMTKPTHEIEKQDHYKEYEEGRMYYNGGHSQSNHMDNDYYMPDHDTTWRDEREGRSYNSRRMYMEAKEMKKDKASQLRELEKYMQELTQDMTEMIGDASTDEKSYLEKKLTALATKIGQMK